MLYVTTHSRQDAYPALRTLIDDTGPDGGAYMPLRLLPLPAAQVEALPGKSFGAGMALVLNTLFSARMNEWDVEFTLGRSPVQVHGMQYRVLLAELWHNPERDFCQMVRCLCARMLGRDGIGDTAAQWAVTAVRIGALFGVYAMAGRPGLWDKEHPVDAAVPEGNFSLPCAVWYAREMGLPVGKIVCGCPDSGGIWELLRHGAFHPARWAEGPERTEWLQSVLCGCFGWPEAERFREAMEKDKLYCLGPEQTNLLQACFYPAAVSERRVRDILSRPPNGGEGRLDAESARSYGAIQDYRAITAKNAPALILAERPGERRRAPGGSGDKKD